MAEKALKKTRYINVSTGEVVHELSSFVDMQFNEEGYLFWNRKNAVKTFLDMPLPDVFGWAEKGRIGELRHFILKDNQFLVYRSGNKLKPVDIAEMCRIFKVCARKCKAFVKKMKQYRILKEVFVDDIRYFAFNPIYGLKEKRLSLHVFLIFQQELEEVLPPWVIERFAVQANELRPNLKIVP